MAHIIDMSGHEMNCRKLGCGHFSRCARIALDGYSLEEWQTIAVQYMILAQQWTTRAGQLSKVMDDYLGPEAMKSIRAQEWASSRFEDAILAVMSSLGRMGALSNAVQHFLDFWERSSADERMTRGPAHKIAEFFIEMVEELGLDGLVKMIDEELAGHIGPLPSHPAASLLLLVSSFLKLDFAVRDFFGSNVHSPNAAAIMKKAAHADLHDMDEVVKLCNMLEAGSGDAIRDTATLYAERRAYDDDHGLEDSVPGMAAALAEALQEMGLELPGDGGGDDK